MPADLVDLEVHEISLVKRPANKKKFIIFKTEDPMPGKLKLNAETEDKFNEVIKAAALPDETIETIKEALALLGKVKGEIPAGVLSNLAALVGYETKTKDPSKKEDESKINKEQASVIKKAIEALKDEKQNSNVTEMLNGLLGKENAKKSEVNLMSGEAKEKIEALYKAREDQEKKIEELQKSLDSAKSEMLLKEFISKAEEDYKNMPIKAEDLGALLKTVNEHNENAGKQLAELLTKADGMVGESKLMYEVGTNVRKTESNNTFSKIDSLAKSMIEKSEKPLSRAQAISEILKTNPELYSEYEAQR